MEEKQWRDVKMKMKGLFYLFLLMKMCSSCDASKRTIKGKSQKSIDIDNHLKRINKTPVKSIKSPDGDIIDCVDIYKQPAFDHPLLKNHSILMRPSHIPEGLFPDEKSSQGEDGNSDISSESIIHQLWHENGRCPKGTIPIRRTTKEDLLRDESFSSTFGNKSPENMTRSKYETSDTLRQEQAEAVFLAKNFGGKARINIWQPKVQQSNEFSLSRMLILGGPIDKDFNSIEVGWQVRPSLYGTFNTRLYVYWTGDGQNSTGCYDLRCPGFVQTNRNVVLGSSFKYTSKYWGSQYDLEFTIFKAPGDGNWWLAYNRADIIGYWPYSLLPYLNDGATDVRVGGQIMNRASEGGNHTKTEMGSGHFPKEGFRGANYIYDVKVVNSSILSQNPDPYSYYMSSSKPACYGISVNQYDDGNTQVYHGGPGRNEDCH